MEEKRKEDEILQKILSQSDHWMERLWIRKEKKIILKAYHIGRIEAINSILRK